jgi:predicted Zn-dependent protease with MMP-like domain
MTEPFAIDDETFEDWVFDALDELPERIRAGLGSLAVLIEDEAPADLKAHYNAYDLYGHFRGFHLGMLDGAGVRPPSTITIYKGPCTRSATTIEGVHERVRATVHHEVGHQLGIPDERLHELAGEHQH